MGGPSDIKCKPSLQGLMTDAAAVVSNGGNSPETELVEHRMDALGAIGYDDGVVNLKDYLALIRQSAASRCGGVFRAPNDFAYPADHCPEPDVDWGHPNIANQCLRLFRDVAENGGKSFPQEWCMTLDNSNGRRVKS